MTDDLQPYHESFYDTITRQTEWVEGSGLLLIIAIYLGGIGAAAFTVALLIDFAWGMVIGWILAVVGKGTFHLVFLGRPLRIWRAARRPHSSWLSRGLWAMVLFAIVGGAVTLPAVGSVVPGVPTIVSPATVQWLAPIAVVLGCFLFVYDGFLLGASSGIPFWSSGLMPFLIPSFSFLAGVTLTVLLFALLDLSAHAFYETIRWIELFALVLTSFVLTGSLVSLWHSNEMNRKVIVELLTGRIAPFLLPAVVLIIFNPLVLLFVELGLAMSVSLWIYVLIGCLAVGGEILYKYSLFKAGYYPPLLTRS